METNRRFVLKVSHHEICFAVIHQDGHLDIEKLEGEDLRYPFATYTAIDHSL